MPLRLYNSLTKTVEEFHPVFPGVVRMYNCGPTIYKTVHIGNFRSFIFADTLRRRFEQLGYRIIQVLNLTDVGHMTYDDAGEDKMLVSAREENMTPMEISRKYSMEFFEDIRRLRIKAATVFPYASEHIDDIVQIIQVLLAKGHAYRVNGSIYFDVTSFPEYGKLSGNTVADLKPGARVNVIDEKRNPSDFALWVCDERHVLQWETELGKGYPGWHIECSAMAARYLTPAYDTGQFNPGAFVTVDVHSGGEDNMFPHHECEIAQSEGATGKRFVNYWLHIKHLIVDGEKMSKSLGNVYTISDLVNKGHDPRAIRWALMATNYRQQMNFTFDGLEAAKRHIRRLDELKKSLDADSTHLAEGSARFADKFQQFQTDFDNALDDDMNLPAATAVVLEYVTWLNKVRQDSVLTTDDHLAAMNVLKHFNEIFDVLDTTMDSPEASVPPEIIELIRAREEARQGRRFSEADAIRDEINKRGYVLRDTDKGTIAVPT